MARSYWGVTPTQLALQDLGNTLQQGIGGIGTQAVRMEELGLRRAKQDFDMGRQKKADTRADELWELGKPEREIQSNQNTQKLAWMNTDVNLNSFGVNNEAALAHWMNPPTNGDPTLFQKATNLLGVQYDTNPESPTKGKFVKPDGTILKNKDMMTRSEDLYKLIASNTDPIYMLDGQKMQSQLDLQKLLSQGAKADDPKVKELQGRIAGIDKALNSDEAKLAL